MPGHHEFSRVPIAKGRRRRRHSPPDKAVSAQSFQLYKTKDTATATLTFNPQLEAASKQAKPSAHHDHSFHHRDQHQIQSLLRQGQISAAVFNKHPTFGKKSGYSHCYTTPPKINNGQDVSTGQIQYVPTNCLRPVQLLTITL